MKIELKSLDNAKLYLKWSQFKYIKTASLLIYVRTKGLRLDDRYQPSLVGSLPVFGLDYRYSSVVTEYNPDQSRWRSIPTNTVRYQPIYAINISASDSRNNLTFESQNIFI